MRLSNHPDPMAPPRNISRSIYLLTLQWREALRYSATLRHAKGLAHLARAHLTGADEKLRQLGLALPLLADGKLKRLASKQLGASLDGDASLRWRAGQIGWERYRSMIKNSPHVSRTVMVKAPGPNGERGVLITYFEYNFQRLLAGIQDFKQFTDRYSIIYSTSWSPTNYHLLASLVAETSGPVWIQACNYGEISALEALHPRVRCLPTLPCDWLGPDYYPVKPAAERDIDLLVVSNWAPFKRHWALFNALRDLPPEWKVVCVGQPETGHTLADIKRLQQRFGAPQTIEYHERLAIDQVTALQVRSKVGAVFSRHEGCCVAATETLMAGAALALIEGARVGPLAYIDESTGVALRESHLAEDLRRAVAEADHMRPRAFAESRLSCHESARRLTDLLKREALAEGRPWTQDIETPVWRPYPRLLREASQQKLEPATAELSDLYPQVFAPDFLQTSYR